MTAFHTGDPLLKEAVNCAEKAELSGAAVRANDNLEAVLRPSTRDAIDETIDQFLRRTKTEPCSAVLAALKPKLASKEMGLRNGLVMMSQGSIDGRRPGGLVPMLGTIDATRRQLAEKADVSRITSGTKDTFDKGYNVLKDAAGFLVKAEEVETFAHQALEASLAPHGMLSAVHAGLKAGDQIAGVAGVLPAIMVLKLVFMKLSGPYAVRQATGLIRNQRGAAISLR